MYLNKQVQNIWDNKCTSDETIDFMVQQGIKFIDICNKYICCHTFKGKYKFVLPPLIKTENGLETWETIKHPFFITGWDRITVFYTYRRENCYSGWVLYSHPVLGLKAEHDNHLYTDLAGHGYGYKLLSASNMKKMAEKLSLEKEYPLI